MSETHIVFPYSQCTGVYLSFCILCPDASPRVWGHEDHLSISVHCMSLILGLTTEVAAGDKQAGSIYSKDTPENSPIRVWNRVEQGGPDHLNLSISGLFYFLCSYSVDLGELKLQKRAYCLRFSLLETRCDDVALAGFSLGVILLPPPFQCRADGNSNLLSYCLGRFEVSLLEMQFWLS